MLCGTPMVHKPYYPLHKVLTFLLCRNDSLQAYTLAMQEKGVGRQQHSCFHRRCLRYCHHQIGHGACRETMGCKSSKTKKGGDTLKIGWGPACLNTVAYLPFWSKVECLGFGHVFLDFLQNKNAWKCSNWCHVILTYQARTIAISTTDLLRLRFVH